MQGVSNQASTVMGAINTQPANSPASSAAAMMLKKALQGQKDDTAQLLQMLEGKGKIVDIKA